MGIRKMLAGLNALNTATRMGEVAAPQHQPQPGPQPRLVRAAHEFEGMMMKELLAPMTEGDALTGSDGDELDAGSGGALNEFASEALGQAVSAGGGFGIANLILHQLSHSGNRHETGNVTRNLHRNTAMKTSE